jgi:hypothetical protein
MEMNNARVLILDMQDWNIPENGCRGECYGDGYYGGVNAG